jgi:hypothetical protein
MIYPTLPTDVTDGSFIPGGPVYPNRVSEHLPLFVTHL